MEVRILCWFENLWWVEVLLEMFCYGKSTWEICRVHSLEYRMLSYDLIWNNLCLQIGFPASFSYSLIHISFLLHLHSSYSTVFSNTLYLVYIFASLKQGLKEFSSVLDVNKQWQYRIRDIRQIGLLKKGSAFIQDPLNHLKCSPLFANNVSQTILKIARFRQLIPNIYILEVYSMNNTYYHLLSAY